MKLFGLILVFFGLLCKNITKGHTIPNNETIANATMTENEILSQLLTEITKMNRKMDTIFTLIFCIWIICFLHYLKVSSYFDKFVPPFDFFEKKEEPTIEEKTRTAFHEAGHAIVAFFHKDGRREIKEISIRPENGLLGYVTYQPQRIWQLKTKVQILAEIAAKFGGRIIEELRYGVDQIDEGARLDISNATALAREMVSNFGMSEKIGLQKLYSDMSEKTKEIFEEEVNAILKDAYEKAKEIMMEHMDQLDDLAYAILEYETLNGNQVKNILERSLKKTLAKDDNANSVYFFVKKEI